MDSLTPQHAEEVPFTNEPVDLSGLPAFEKVTFQPLHKDYLNVVYISNTIFAVLLSLAFLVMVFVNDWFMENILWLAGVKLLFIGLLFLVANKAFKRKGYALREKDVLFTRGLIAHKTTVIPLNRIQHVALHEGFLSRMYDLSEVQIYTAGGSSSDLSIPGVPKEEALKIKNYLLAQILGEPELEEETPAFEVTPEPSATDEPSASTESTDTEKP